MNTDAIISLLIEADRELVDIRRHRIATEQRVWAICSRLHRAPDGLKVDKAKTEALKKKVLARGEPMLAQRCEIFVRAWEEASAAEAAVEKEMAKLAKQLPAWEWVSRQKGAGLNNFARIVANAGRDLGDYTTPAKLWMRFGLAVIDGKAHKPKKGEKLGYSLERRALMHVTGDCLWRQKGFWYEVGLRRKEYEREQARVRGLIPLEAGEEPPKGADKAKYMTAMHVHKRALRYMEKKFLSALWEEWTGDRRPENLPDFVREAA